MAIWLALFGGVFPLLRRVAGAQLAVATAGRPAPVGSEPSLDAASPGPRVAALMAGSQDVFSIEAETVQTLVTHDPARTAQVIRGWIAGDRGALKRA